MSTTQIPICGFNKEIKRFNAVLSPLVFPNPSVWSHNISLHALELDALDSDSETRLT